ncbi:MAG TPA: VWA domain-containing protein [Bryobacteraceae bacterium]
MMRRRIVFLCLPAITAAAQETPLGPTFRTGTELVQVSVVAQDKSGKAVADLHREDFQIYDNGVPQNIAVFLAAKPAPEREVAIPAGVFTNQIATDAGTGYSVLLFDNLNIDRGQNVVAYTARAREKALQALRAIPPGDRIAIYALWCQFQVFREFTSDRDSLIQQLEKFALAPANCINSGDGPEHALTERYFSPGFAQPTANPGRQTRRGKGQAAAAASHEDDGSEVGSAIQADIADNEIEQLAEHLAGIPGRKNLIWLTTTFRLKPSNLQRLINANVAIYPVDTIGSTIGLAAYKEARYAPIRALAAITGGKAYLDRDDLDVAIGDALNDGRISYTLGFYRPEADRNASVHRIEVRTSHEGVVLRYRTSYSVDAPRQKEGNPAQAPAVQAMVDAINRPVNATAIAMTALATRNENRVNLVLSYDASALDLQERNGLWEGQAELVVRFMTNDGRIAGKVIALTMSFHLRPATYATALRRGLQLRREIEIPAKAVDLNLLVGSLASGKIGTLTIPLSEVRSAGGAVPH